MENVWTCAVRRVHALGTTLWISFDFGALQAADLRKQWVLRVDKKKFTRPWCKSYPQGDVSELGFARRLTPRSAAIGASRCRRDQRTSLPVASRT